MKKLFTLFAFLTCFLGAKAVTVVDFEKDYSTAATWEHGWLNEEAHIKFEDGAIHFHSDEAQSAFFDFQYQLHPGIQVDNDAHYTITLRIKGTVAQEIHASFSGSGTPGMIPVTTDWADVVLEDCVNDPKAAYFASSGSLLIQPGDYVGDIWITYIKITHEEKESRPATWQEWLTDDGQPIIPGVEHTNKWMGDAEFGQWPDWALAKDESGVNINWRGERTGEICAWSIVRGKNIDPSQTPDPVNDPDGNPIAEGKPRPFPCDIEEVPGGHAFVVHSTAADNQYTDWQAWDNQFFIMSPKGWKSGSVIRVSFKYKAEKAATAQTQIHHQNPSWYLFYQGIGDVNFTTEWQEYSKEITFSDSQNDGWCVAFNLNVDNKEPNTFYFDDLKWETMVLDEGFFVASSNSTTGIEYDFDNATEFVEGVDPNNEPCLVATVGTEGKQDTWVNEVMISTLRGHDKSFKGATIKPEGTIKGDDPDDWKDYQAGSSYKIALPAAGVWKIYVAPSEEDATKGQVLFMKVEGEANKEPVDIVANSEVLEINGVERDWLASDDGNPKAGEDEVGTGQTWDNQFFIVANRVLKGDEETVIEFDYVATLDAKTLTGTAAMPGQYRKNAFGDVDFTTTEQHFKADFKIPASDWGGNAITDAQTISFDMAVIKAANNYTIKNVKWYLKGDENENGKTLENLIDATGTKNFWVKISAGTDPYPYGTDPSGINNVVAKSNASTATYNLAGQRISKEYKGIVIKDGKKVVVK